jgi:CRP-like cAMP-binding protein
MEELVLSLFAYGPIVAKGSCTVWQLPVSDFHSIIQTNPQFVFEIVNSLATHGKYKMDQNHLQNYYQMQPIHHRDMMKYKQQK